jgi:hypothetical protein
MTGLFRLVAAHAIAVCIAGCAIQGSTIPTAAVTPTRAKVIVTAQIKDAVAIGKSTKADVIASLGETRVISFDTGYEVWVYRLANDTPLDTAAPPRIARSASEKAWPQTAAEFVILFGPSGLVAKTRMRPAS